MATKDWCRAAYATKTCNISDAGVLILYMHINDVT